MLLVAWMTGADASAQTPQALHPPVFVTIVDARPAPDDVSDVDAAAKTVATFPKTRISGATVRCDEITKPAALNEVWGLIECATTASNQIEERVRAARAIAEALPELAKEGSTRAVSDKGEYIHTAVIQMASLRRVRFNDSDPQTPSQLDLTVEGRRPKVVVNETARKSQIQQDTEALLKVIGALAAPAMGVQDAQVRSAGAPEMTVEVSDVPFMTVHVHALRETRATVKIDVSVPADRPAVRLAQGLPDKALEELLKIVEARLKQKADEAEAAKQKKALDDLRAQCPPAGAGAYSPLRILACRLLSDAVPDDRIAAADALGSVGTRDAILPLTIAANTPHPGVRAAALRSLGKLTAAPQPAAPRPEQGASAPANPVRTVSLLSGPMEHWFLSADVIVTSKDQITREEDMVVLSGKPPSFYIGFGFLLGDLASSKRTLLGNLAFKLLVQGSKSPQDSIGAAVALRGEYLKKWGLNFDLLSPFAAYTWTRDDATDTRKRELRFGAAVNIDKAVDWLK